MTGEALCGSFSENYFSEYPAMAYQSLHANVF